VEPRGPPRPAAPAEAERPVVEAAGGRIRGRELGHARGHREREDGDERPAHRVHDRARELQPVAVEEDRAREDGDDREGDREVGEASHLAEELLGVAEAAEVFRVGIELLATRAHSGVTYAAVMPPSTVNVAPLT